MRSPSTVPSRTHPSTRSCTSSKTSGSSTRTPDQRGDVEEPPVVQHGQALAPVRQHVVLPVEQLAQRLRCGRRVQPGERTGGDRQAGVEVGDRPLVARGLDVQVAGHELVGQRRAEDRQEHLAAEELVVDVPVDVEATGELAVAAVAEHVEPPAVAAVGDAQVVGHDVDHLTEPGRPQGLDHAGVGVGPAELVVHASRIDAVVAVGGSGDGLDDRRQVRVRDPELRRGSERSPRRRRSRTPVAVAVGMSRPGCARARPRPLRSRRRAIGSRPCWTGRAP